MRKITDNKRLPSFRSIWLLIGLSQLAIHASAQSVPADLLELSIDDLLSTNVDSEVNKDSTTSKPWSFSYSYHNSQFSDYLDNSTRLDLDEVLFSPGEEPRTDKNFPVVPTDIEQEVHSVVLSYDIRADASVSVSVPYVKQSTDHISIVPGYSEFNISSSGLGDIAVLGNFRFAESISGHWQAGSGLSLPTGSIDEEGDTPRAPGSQQLPYTMQLGSGTYDVPAYIAYRGNSYAFDWGLGLSGKLRLGENDRDYRLGHTISASTWLQLTTLSYAKPSLKLTYRYSGEIDGEDESLSVPGPFPYPAPVVDPSLFGGEVLSLVVGLELPLFSPYRYVDLEFGKPLYQSLNGPQSSEDYRFSITFGVDF
ncbi:MAG: hypothetical protein ABJN62_11450 [Halioglobus sp.]